MRAYEFMGPSLVIEGKNYYTSDYRGPTEKDSTLLKWAATWGAVGLACAGAFAVYELVMGSGDFKLFDQFDHVVHDWADTHQSLLPNGAATTHPGDTLADDLVTYIDKDGTSHTVPRSQLPPGMVLGGPTSADMKPNEPPVQKPDVVLPLGQNINQGDVKTPQTGLKDIDIPKVGPNGKIIKAPKHLPGGTIGPSDLTTQDPKTIKVDSDQAAVDDQVIAQLIDGSKILHHTVAMLQKPEARMLVKMAHEQGIKGRELLYFLGQVAHESGFDPTAENQNSHFKYRAKGLIQLDGIGVDKHGHLVDDPAVYKMMQRSIMKHYGDDVDLVGHPELAKDPKWSYKIAICYWLDHVHDRVKFNGKNVTATVHHVTRLIAGDRLDRDGVHLQGEVAREQHTREFIKSFDIADAAVKRIKHFLGIKNKK